MLFTKIWTAVLAVLATLCLAGMYLLSTGSGGKFTDADKLAVRAVTEAGMAALASDVNSSPVALGPSLLADTRLQEALNPPPPPVGGKPPKPVEDGFEETPEQKLARVFDDVANESLLNEHPLMSAALIDKAGSAVATAGVAPELFAELATLLNDDPLLQTAMAGDDAPDVFAATLGGRLHAIKISRPITEADNKRLVTIQAVDLEGGSFFRRVVGTNNPAGLVRGKQIIGEPIGGAKPEELIAWVETHVATVPPEGASTSVEVGSGGESRLGAGARVPGPAGKGKDGTVFVVLSAHNLASTQQDMATTLSAALNEDGLGQLNWPLVLGLLVISLILTFYLPHIEFTAPMKRLRAELEAVNEGRKHQLDHDTYGGHFLAVGRSFSAALEAQRLAFDAGMVDPDADPGAARRTRGTRALRSTRGTRRPSREHEALESAPEEDEGIELPSAAPAEVERHAAADRPVIKPSGTKPASPPPSPRPTPPSAPPQPAPTLQDAPTFQDTDDDISNPGIDLAAPTGPSVDREAYYHQIFNEFVETKTACGESVEGFTYEKFAKKLRKQSEDLLARPDVKDVEFSVYVKDGKAALRAKVVKA